MRVLSSLCSPFPQQTTTLVTYAFLYTMSYIANTFFKNVMNLKRIKNDTFSVLINYL